MKETAVFFGGDSRVGTTMISQSVAEYFSESGANTLYLQCGGKVAEGYFRSEQETGLDDLKAGILTGKVSAEDVQNAIEKVKGLSVIRGVRNPYSAAYFPENSMEILLEAVKADFDYLIVDAGANINLGMAVSALNQIAKRYYVLTQQHNVLQRYRYLQEEVLRPLHLEGQIILNKYLKEPSLYKKKEIETLCGEAVNLAVPYMEYGWQSEMEGKTLNGFARFSKGIGEIGRSIKGEVKSRKRWRRNFV